MPENAIPITVNLPERLLLLAADNDTGRIDTRLGTVDFGLAGATFTELILIKRLAIVDGKVTVTDPAATGDPILDDALATIAAAKPQGAKHWVTNLPKSQLRDRVLARLVDHGILRREEQRFLWVIPDNRYLAENDAPERDVRDAVTEAVAQGEQPSPRTAALIGILKASDLTGSVFTRDERKRYRDRIDEIAKSEPVDGSVNKAIKDMRTAKFTAISVGGVLGGTS